MKIYKNIFLLAAAIVFAVSCKKSAFVNTNIDPNTLYSVDPAAEFLEAGANSQSSFEYYYDVYREINYWMQYTTNPAGNSLAFTTQASNFNARYGVFYGSVGRDLSDIPVQISRLTPEQQAKKINIINIATIFKAYYAFYVSDINGSIPYTQAFQARQGGTLTPTYDPQEVLFDTLDAQIKAAVKTLETPQAFAQDSLGANDPFFGSFTGNATSKWIKAGNALRLKIAMRLMKRDPAKLQAIATDVLTDPNQMSSIDDSWQLLVGPAYADANGNYNAQGFPASKPMISFMSTTGDPRERMFYTKNKDGAYVGSFPSPDDAKLPQNLPLYAVSSGDTLSKIQPRLFTPNYDDGTGAGTGVGFYPMLTFAEYCFIRAELGAEGVTGDNAATWYATGVTASIQYYDQRAIAAQVTGYVPVTPAEIAAYLTKPGVAFDPTKAVEQIACQAYIDFFRQPSEGWAWWKRTGFPNTTSVLAWSDLKANGAELPLPRRAALTPPLPTYSNYTNQKAAYDAMAADPDFGPLNDGFGRVWWDKQ